MRRRSNAVHASSFDEFKVISVEKQAEPVNAISSPYAVSLLTRSLQQPRPQKLESVKDRMRSDPNLWKEFDFYSKPTQQEEEDMDEMSQPSTAESSYCGSPMGMSPLNKSVKQQVRTVNAMMIGSQDTGLHKILDGIFEEQPCMPSLVNKAFDLVVKEHEVDEQHYKMKFWIQDPNSHKHDVIISVYYKTIQHYVFVYRPDDRQSFSALVEAVEKIKTQVVGKFSALLVRDTTGLDAKMPVEVSEEEGEKLVEKYGFIKEIKINESVQETRQEVLKMFERQSVNKTVEFLIREVPL